MENTEYAEKQKRRINFFRAFRDFRSLIMQLIVYLEKYSSFCNLVMQMPVAGVRNLSCS